MATRMFALLLVGALLVGGCTDQSTSPQAGENVTLSIGVAPSGSTRAANNNAAAIESAKILLKNIKFHRFPSDNGQDIKVGPFVVDLNLAGSLNTVAAAKVPAGQYDRVKFTLHKPEEFEPIPDQEFREGTSGQLRFSVIVRGTYNGQTFVYKSRENASQEIRFAKPITVADDGMVNVTLIVDTHTWFVQNGVALDPADPANSSAIDDAIKASFRNAFRDDNRDGRSDDL
jgi:hypothetical protein